MPAKIGLAVLVAAVGGSIFVAMLSLPYRSRPVNKSPGQMVVEPQRQELHDLVPVDMKEAERPPAAHNAPSLILRVSSIEMPANGGDPAPAAASESDPGLTLLEELRGQRQYKVAALQAEVTRRMEDKLRLGDFEEIDVTGEAEDLSTPGDIAVRISSLQDGRRVILRIKKGEYAELDAAFQDLIALNRRINLLSPERQRVEVFPIH
jgi:hypothetical protein